MPRQYLPEVYLQRLVCERTGMRVIAGSFMGLSYVDKAVGSAYIPKLLGTYERELHPIIEEIVREEFGTIIDVGAAEGYYAIGLARRLPGARVHAFEMTECGRTLLSQMASANGVTHRLQIRGKCDVSDLRDCLESLVRPLVICDAEGYEVILLDPDAIPYLLNSYILVELHDFINRGISNLIESRFSDSHDITEIVEEGRTAADFPFYTLYTRLLPERFLLNAVREWRPERMAWFWMRPRNAGH